MIEGKIVEEIKLPVADKTPDFTTERFYVEHTHQHGRDLLIRHVRRYKWAASHIPQGGRVLDVGCGSGYGDFILLGKAGEVLGIDVSEEAIDYATAKAIKSPAAHLKYLRHNALDDVHVGAMQFDVCVCIEMFEHVSLIDQAQLLRNVRKWLVPGGTFVMTTPARQGQRMTEFHEHEVTKAELDAMLSVVFEHVTFDDPVMFGLPDNFILAVCRTHEVAK